MSVLMKPLYRKGDVVVIANNAVCRVEEQREGVPIVWKVRHSSWNTQHSSNKPHPYIYEGDIKRFATAEERRDFEVALGEEDNGS